MTASQMKARNSNINSYPRITLNTSLECGEFKNELILAVKSHRVQNMLCVLPQAVGETGNRCVCVFVLQDSNKVKQPPKYDLKRHDFRST